MNQAEQEQDYVAARAWLDRSESTLGLDRCRHESVEETSLWLFEHVTGRKRGEKGRNVQVGCVKRLPPSPARDATSHHWESTRMMNGQPTARRCFVDLDSALNWIESYTHGRVNAA